MKRGDVSKQDQGVEGRKREAKREEEVPEEGLLERVESSAEELERSEERYRELVENINDGYLVVRGRKVVFANRRCADLLGYPVRQIVGKNFADLVAEESREGAAELYKRSMSGERLSERREALLRRKDGTKVPVEMTLKDITYDGRPAVSAMFCDITERKGVERELWRRTFELGERVKELNCLYSLSNLVQRRDIALAEVFQGAVELVPPTLQYPDVACARLLIEGQEYRTGNFVDTEWRISCDVTVHGEVIGKLDVCYAEEVQKSYGGVFLPEERAVLHAVCGRLGETIERRRAEGEIRASKEKYRHLLEEIHDGYLVVQGGRVVFANTRLGEILGYGPEALGRPVNEFMPEYLLGRATELRERVVSGEDISEPMETTVLTKDGAELPIEVSIKTTEYEGKLAIAVLVRDISERRRAEEMRRREEEKYRYLYEYQPAVNFIIGNDGTLVDINQAGLSTFGYTKDELVGRGVLDHVVPEERERVAQQMARAFQGEHTPGLDVDIYASDGSVHTMWFSPGHVIPADGAQQAIMLATGVDVTERKMAEEERRRAEERYRQLLEDIDDGYFVVQDGKIVFANTRCTEILGYGPEAIGESVATFVPPGQEHHIAAFGEAFSGEGEVALHDEMSVLTKDGSEVPVEIHARRALYMGRPALTVVIRDISERARAERELKASEQRYKALLEDINDGYFVVQDGVIVFGNGRLAEMFGYSLDEVLGSRLVDIALDSAKDMVALMMFAFEQGGAVPERVEITGTDPRGGGDITIEIRMSVIDYLGRPAINGIIRDITDRKRVEMALQAEKAYSQSLVHSLPDMLLTIDPEGKISYANDVMVVFTGVELEQLVGRPLGQVLQEINILDARTATLVTRRMKKRLKTGLPARGVELEMRNARGEWVKGLYSTSVIKSPSGEILGQVVVISDITDRVKAEEELKRSEEKYRRLVEDINDGYFVLRDTTILFANERMAEMMGYGLDEIVGEEFLRFLAPEAIEVPTQVHQRSMAGDAVAGRYETVVVRKDGSRMEIDFSLKDITFEGRPAVSIVARDITERKRAEKELKASEEKYRELVENINDAYAVVRRENLVYVNKRCEDIFGYTAGEMVGRSFFEMLAPEVVEQNLKILAASLDGGDLPDHYETTAITKSGQRVEIDVSIHPITYEGRPAFSVMARDVSDRKRAEDELKQSEDKFRHLVNDMLDGYVVLQDGTIRFVNAALAQMSGYSSEELVGRRYDDLLAVDTSPLAKDIRRRVAEGVEVMERFRGEIIREDGTVLPVEAGIKGVEYEGRTAVSVVVRDITERKRAEAEIERRNRELAVLNEVAQVVSQSLDIEKILSDTMDLVMDFMETEAGWIALVDRDSNRFLPLVKRGVPPEILAIMPDITPDMGLASHAIRTGQPVALNDIRQNSIDELAKPARPLMGKVEFKALAHVPIDSKGDIIAVMTLGSRTKPSFSEGELGLLGSICHEIGVAIENARLYDEIRAKAQELEKANRHKSEFMASMSHELRTPLNSIIGFSELMLDGITGDINDEQQQCLEDILTSGKQLLILINGVLDISKIEAGKLEVMPEVFDIGEVFDEARRTMSPLVEEKVQTLTMHIEEGMPPMYADKGKIKQVLLNLLSNAVRYTNDGGSIAAEARREGDLCRISVADTGIGIREKDLENVFQAFTQVGESPLKKEGGTGLGLAIAKQFVEINGGMIWVESEYGKGSTFIFTVPIYRADMKHSEAKREEMVPTAAEGGERCIMVVDDDRGARSLMRRWLEAEGYSVCEVSQGAEAVETAKRIRPAVVTLDIMMPGEDGWTVLRSLKTTNETQDIPVVIASMVENRELGFALGAVDYFVKPVEKERFLKRLTELGIGKRERVLVVDDEPRDVRLTSAILESEGMEVLKAYGGKDGLKLARERQPSLIVLDLLMPDMDGFEVVRHLREDESTQDIPIAIVTMKELSAEEEAELASQVQSVMQKASFDRNAFIAEIRRIEGPPRGG